MSLVLRAYGDGHKLFPLSDRKGSYAEASSFGDFLPNVHEAASFYCLHAIITQNTYNLGSHEVRVEVDGTTHAVLVSSYGERLEFSAPTIKVLMAVWNKHMEGVAACLGGGGRGLVRVRVYAEEGNPLTPIIVGDGRAYADFDGVDAVPGQLRQGALIYVFVAMTAQNQCLLGEYPVEGQRDSALVMATGMGVSVSSSSFDFARMTFDLYLAAIDGNMARAREAYDRIVQMRTNWACPE